MQRSRARLLLLFFSLFFLFLVHRQLGHSEGDGIPVYQPGFSLDEHFFDDDASPDTVKENVVYSPPPPKFKPPRLCQSYECAVGKWIPRRDPFRSIQHVQTVYSNLWHPVWAGCDILPDASGKLVEGEEKARLEGQRLVNTLNWEWIPDRGDLLEYDTVDFVVRMLKSPGGLVLVGDSITRQWWHGIYYTFRHLNITFDSNPKHLRLAGAPNVEQFVLSKSSPMTKILQEKAGVPQSRMERPFFTLLEDHMTVNETDIRAITNAKPDYKWFHKFRQVEGWVDHLKYLAKPREGEQESVTEDTLVVINAGAHWSRHELAMLRRPTDTEEQELLEETYARMIDLLVGRLSPIERTSIYYRSTAPGHPDCKNADAPYKDMLDARFKERNLVQRLQDAVDTPDDKKMRSRWDWDMFKPHNLMWNRTISSLMERRPKDSKGAKWFYFDVWDLSLQRPDAHAEPGKDCLHWCLPTVFDDWTNLLYHRVQIEEHTYYPSN